MVLVPAMVFVLGAAPRFVEVKPRESVEDIARRELGSASAAGELRALNALDGGTPPVGTRVRLPGEEREKAVNALRAAQNAFAQRDARTGKASDAAGAQLAEAERLLSEARYEEAARAADGAWQMLSKANPPATTFSVEVKDDGASKVTARRGQPVRVEAQGVQRAVSPGHMVTVVRGATPTQPRPLPQPPVLAVPRADARLRLAPDEKGQLGPVNLKWKKATGATGYSVEVVPDRADPTPLVLTSARPAIELPPMPPGRYRWQVHAVGDDGERSAPSEPRWFVLEPTKLKLEVRGTDWK